VIASLSATAAELHSAVVPLYDPPIYKQSMTAVRFEYLATLINDTDELAKNCRIDLKTDLPIEFVFWSTDPDTQISGEHYRRIDIRPREAQTFGFRVSAAEKLDSNSLILFPLFECDNLAPAKQIVGTNSIDLSAAKLSGLERLFLRASKALSREKPVTVLGPLTHRPNSQIMLPEYRVPQRFRPPRPANTVDLNLEQAALISQLKPKRWTVSRGGPYASAYLLPVESSAPDGCRFNCGY